MRLLVLLGGFALGGLLAATAACGSSRSVDLDQSSSLPGEAGDRCQLDMDCSSPLVCCVCEPPRDRMIGTCLPIAGCTLEFCGVSLPDGSDGSVD